jgi:hypothetical protein
VDILGDLAGSRRLTGYRCFMHRLREADPALAEQAEKGIASSIGADDVAQWLVAHGAGHVSGQQVRNHRRGLCVTCRS